MSQAETDSAALHVYNIAAGQPFLPRLAAALLDDAHRATLFGACRLEDVQILLPTRRAARMLAGELLAQSAADGQNALLLPRIDTLGDLDEDMPDTLTASIPQDELPPAIDKMARHFHLLPLVAAWAEQGGLGSIAGETLNPVKLSALVHDLEAFLDQTQNEQARLNKLDTLAPESLAENWQHIVSLLNIVLRYWPAQLDELERMDPTARRNALLDQRRQSWHDAPPTHPILAAGSTGSIRATADLLAVIARLPRGGVVLPGLDETSDEDMWRAIAKDDMHPQYALAQLLDHMQATPSDIRRFPGSDAAAPRVALLNRALVPAVQTADWVHTADDESAAHLDGLTLIEAPDIRAEAGAIALAMRGVLETPDKTAALVTRDRNLARRVAAELRRWGIEIDDSAGQPLANLPRARLLRLVLEAQSSRFAPVDMLALLKHPLVCLGHSRGAHLAAVRELENAVLRGPRPFGGLAGIKAALAQKTAQNEPLNDNDKAASQTQAASQIQAQAQAEALLTRLEAAFAPLSAPELAKPAPMASHLQALRATAEVLLADDDVPVNLFGTDEEGRALAALFEPLNSHSGLAPQMTRDDFRALFDMWLMRQSVRRQLPGQPRLAILGPLEARLMQADVMFLGGLNETVWPPMPETGPWLSRPMRAALGMSQPERQIGQAAHDFVQASAAPQVYLTRAKKIDGAPSVAARWLRRLETLAGALPRRDGDALINWWQQLDKSAAAPAPETAPRPCPPLKARPGQLSVTQIETLLHNPYEIYARKILRLRALEAVDAPPNAAHRGIFLHHLMERYIAQGLHKEADAAAAFLRLAEAEQAAHPGGTALMQFWQARLEALAFWLADYEALRAQLIEESFVELSGTLTLGDFTVTAKADRIDKRGDGRYEIIDYKTGQAPGKKQLEAYLAPQLTLEAAILRDGAFVDRRGQKPVTLSGATAALTYLRLSGRTPAAAPDARACDDTLVDGALDMLRQLVALYDDAAQPYLVHIRPRQGFGGGFGGGFGARNLTELPFDHLARTPEWLEEDEA